MSVVSDGELAEFRREATGRMASRALVRRKVPGEFTTNADGAQVPVWADVYADLPCRIDAGSTSDGGSRGVTIGSRTWEEATGVGRFPYPSELLANNDVFQVTSGEWPGQFFRIVAAIRYDQQTDRRVPIVEVERPEGWA